MNNCKRCDAPLNLESNNLKFCEKCRKEKRAEYYKNWYNKNGRKRTNTYSHRVLEWKLNNPEKVEAHKLYEFGRRVGIAFQLQDDILDVYGDPDKFGKQVGGDIVSNKKTYLLLTALKRANGYHKENLLNWLQSDSKDSEAKVTAVKEIYNAFEVRKAAEAEMHEQFSLGIQSLESIKADQSKIAAIKAVAESLMVRQH